LPISVRKLELFFPKGGLVGHFDRVVFLFIFVVTLGVMPMVAPAQTSSGNTVNEVIVEGNQRIERGTILSYMLIKEGDAFNNRRIDRSLKSLFSTGLFADVTMSREGDSLIVSVVENPVINRIAFEGNSRIDDDTLASEITLRPRVIYTRTKVQNDVKRILTLYRRKGRFAATVEPKVIQQPQNRIDLVFEVKEGKWTEVRNIRFIGNREYSDSRLREEIRTRETRWYRILSDDDNYDPDRLTLDRELLRRFYLSDGYADFQVLSALAELTPDRKNFFITFTVEEGSRYTFGKVDLDIRLKGLKAEQFQDVIEIESGDWYDAEQLEKAIDTMTETISNLGHSFIDIRPRINRDREKLTVAVTFEINEGPRIFVERIDIEGNVRTSDKVIRREFRLVEGDPFNVAQLRRSRQRVQNLDFFEKVDIEEVPGSAPDKASVKVNVEEKSTGALSVGFGFSTTSGPLGDIGITERNLMGRGQEISLKAQVAAKRNQIDLSFTEPYFMDRDIAAGFDVFRTSTDNQDASSYDSKNTGFGLRAGYPVTEHLRQSWRYLGRVDEIENVDSSASPHVRSQAGKETLSEVSHSVAYDRRNDRIFPTEGYILRMTNAVAGVGGTKRHLKNTFSAGQYFPLYDQWVLSVGAHAGHVVGIGKDPKLLDRFFLGGDNLRGFATSGVGPRDKNTKDSLGGEWMYRGSAELKFPLGLPEEMGLSGKLFSDFGSTGDVTPMASDINDTGSLRASVGAGVTWVSPMGPIAVDFGVPVVEEDFDEKEALRVNFGTRF